MRRFIHGLQIIPSRSQFYECLGRSSHIVSLILLLCQQIEARLKNCFCFSILHTFPNSYPKTTYSVFFFILLFLFINFKQLYSHCLSDPDTLPGVFLFLLRNLLQAQFPQSLWMRTISLATVLRFFFKQDSVIIFKYSCVPLFQEMYNRCFFLLILILKNSRDVLIVPS